MSERNRRWVFLVAILTLAALVVAACSGGAETVGSAPATEAQPTQAIEQNEAGQAEEHDGGEGEEHAAGEHDEGAGEEQATGDHDGGEGEEHAAGEHDEGGESGEGSEHEHVAIPEGFEGMTNPFAGDASAAAAGAETYSTYCASCHGPEGKGDGPAAAALDPAPPDFSDAQVMSTMDDAYIFWRISEGGAMEPFNSSMPAWGDSLSDEQIWQLVSYLRELSQ